jgi:molybdopterin-guanine dinucleotide biosynthesis protein MobB
MSSIISFVGKSGSGKTTLLEKVITELKRRGYKIAIIKHSHHKNDLDTAEKDTWRFTKAGTEVSAINSLDNLAIYRKMDSFFEPHDIANYINLDYDIMLTEGFKGSSYPKIEVHRSEQGKELLTDSKLLLAVVTDEPLDIDVPQFSREDVSGIADIIEKRILAQKEKNSLTITINGKTQEINPQFEDLLTQTLTAMIPDLQKNGEVKNLHISLRRQH